MCKSVTYCSAECQKIAWKGHKALCQKPAKLGDLMAQTDDDKLLYMARNIEHFLLHLKSPQEQCALLSKIAHGLRQSMVLNGTHEHISDVIPLFKMRVEILGSMKRFRDQGDETNIIADLYSSLDDYSSAIIYFERARRIGEAHGFFRIECLACRGMGDVFVKQGRVDEGMDLLRNALAAAPLSEFKTLSLESHVLTTILSPVLSPDYVWNSEIETQVNTWTLRYIQVVAETCQMEPDAVGLNHFKVDSWIKRAQFMWRSGDRGACEEALQATLSTIKEWMSCVRIHGLDLVDLRCNLEWVVEFTRDNSDTPKWKDMTNRFQDQLSRIREWS